MIIFIKTHNCLTAFAIDVVCFMAWQSQWARDSLLFHGSTVPVGQGLLIVSWLDSPSEQGPPYCFLARQSQWARASLLFHGSTVPVGQGLLIVSWLHSPSGPGPPYCWSSAITLRHTILGRTPLDEWSALCRDLYLTTHNIHARQTSVPAAGFETKIPANERQQNHAIDRAATDTVLLALVSSVNINF
jgi:hypothetical protein